ncbi:NUDIX hydrolase [Rhizobium sullae]
MTSTSVNVRCWRVPPKAKLPQSAPLPPLPKAANVSAWIVRCRPADGDGGIVTTIVLAAFIHDGRVLLVRRAAHKRQYPEYWDLVGGHVEVGETTDAALVREAQEEVGITPITFRHLKTFPDAATPDCESIRYQVYAVTEWSGGAPRLLGEEHTDLAWVAMGNLCFMTPLAHPAVIPILSWFDLFLRRPRS